MKTIYPDYYKDFLCIADKCKHNCCIGWEIDINPESLKVYQNITGDFGKKLKENISLEGTPHFILTEDERCPFLNCRNLCDIYTNSGEKSLCQICRDHPRFYNRLEDRLEAGLGLCCEEAARLIITNPVPFKLIGEEENPQGLILLRKRVFETLQNRSYSISQRINNLFSLLNISPIAFDVLKWAEFFEGLEQLDKSWGDLLFKLKSSYKTTDKTGFCNYISCRETQYEQFLCYLIYRHASKAEFYEDFVLYVLFSILSYKLIFAMGAVIFTENSDFTIYDQLELMRLFSSEIEYSDENLDIILEKIETEFFG